MADQPPPEFSKMVEDNRALLNGIAGMTMAWSDVETSLVTLLAEVLTHRSIAYASVMYFSLSSLDARIGIVDAAFQHQLHDSNVGQKINKYWARTIKALNHQKTTRNKVAHGQIVTVNMFGKNHMRLTSNIFDFNRMNPSMRSSQLPGLSANDLQNSINAVHHTRKRIDMFVRASKALHVNDHNEALLKTLETLAREFPNPDSPDNPTQSEPSPQLQPSGE